MLVLLLYFNYKIPYFGFKKKLGIIVLLYLLNDEISEIYLQLMILKTKYNTLDMMVKQTVLVPSVISKQQVQQLQVSTNRKMKCFTRYVHKRPYNNTLDYIYHAFIFPKHCIIYSLQEKVTLCCNSIWIRNRLAISSIF